MAGRDGGGPVAAGAVILASFVACDVLATVRVRSKALPIAIAAHAAGPALMLLTKPGTAEPTPDLTDAASPTSPCCS